MAVGRVAVRSSVAVMPLRCRELTAGANCNVLRMGGHYRVWILVW
jgi:hypothetical protein